MPEAARQARAEARKAMAATRRAYNRDYMRRWRERNRNLVREHRRARYQQAAHGRGESEPAAAPDRPATKCVYCRRRPSVQTVERVDMHTWQTITVPYCGFC